MKIIVSRSPNLNQLSLKNAKHDFEISEFIHHFELNLSISQDTIANVTLGFTRLKSMRVYSQKNNVQINF